MSVVVPQAPRTKPQRTPHTRRVRLPGIVSIALCIVHVPVALAQPGALTAPAYPAPEQRREQERLQRQQQRLQTHPEVRVPQAAPPAAHQRLPVDEMPCLLIQKVEFVGEDARQFSGLAQSLASHDGQDSPTGRCLGAAGIELLARRAQDALIAQGYVTTRVLAAPQDVSGGLVQLTVLAGRVSNIQFAHKALRQPALLNAMPIRSGQILNIRDIEQALDNFRRSPLSDAEIRIHATEVPGESELLIDYRQTRTWRLNQAVDDAGSTSTGKIQSATTVNIDSPLGWHDIFYISVNTDIGGRDPGPRGNLGGSLHYSVPWGYSLLSLNISRGRYHQSVAGLNENYLYRGESETAELKFSRLVHRDASNKTTLSLKGFARRSRNYIDDLEVDVQRRAVGGWEVAIEQRSAWGNITLDSNWAYRRGTGAFGAMAAPEEDVGEGTSRFALVSADLRLAGAWTAGEMGQHRGRWSTSLRGQSHRTPLTPQDRFSIGSRYTVRGFDGERSLSAESGWTIRNEISWMPGHSGAGAQGTHEIYAGLDHGRVAGPSTAVLAGQQLTGMVIGLRGSFNAAGANGASAATGISGLSYDIFIGRPVRKPDGFRTPGTTAGLNLSLTY